MANPEHVAILKQGVDVWNMWRRENPMIKADLSLEVFFGVNLRQVNFSQVNLREAIFFAANLREANFFLSNLVFADLRETDLSGANLCRAILFGADLKDAGLFFTNFAGVNLSETKGLENIQHQGPSTIGIDTLYESKGNIPEAFLRGCGVPDHMIQYARSLTGSPIKYYSCFISYSSKDESFAQRLHNDLQAAGVRCWLACEDMKIGDEIRTTIDESIRVHDKLLIILSRYSVGSEWVKDEVEHAIDLEKERKQSVLFPVRIDDAVMESKTGWSAKVQRQRHIGDFTKWTDPAEYSKAFDRLLEDLRAG